MSTLLLVMVIVFMVAMIVFTVFYGYLVARFYKHIWKNKTMFDEYINQRYNNMPASKSNKTVEGEDRDD